MQYLALSIVFLCWLSFANAQQSLDCKVKEGCTAEKCFDGTEFPILCKGKGNQAEFFRLFVMLAGHRKQMENIKTELGELKEVDKVKDNITDDILAELEKMEKTNKNQTEINQSLRNETKELREENEKLSEALKKLRQEFDELKQIVSGSNLNIPDLETEQDATPNITNSTQATPNTTTTTPTTTTTTPEPEPENLCEYRNKDGTCYWMKFHQKSFINYTEAVQECEAVGSNIAQVMSEEDYEAIMKQLRFEMEYWKEVAGAWIGLTIDPLTSEVSPQGAYQQWYRWFYPRTGRSYSHWTHVNLLVDRNPLSYQGMTNDPPTATVNGVVCQDNHGAQIPEVTDENTQDGKLEKMTNEELKKSG
ncbi:uncharacterized protein LOC120332793 [Styela clava]